MQHANNFNLFGGYSIKHCVALDGLAPDIRQEFWTINTQQRLLFQRPNLLFEGCHMTICPGSAHNIVKQ